MTGLLLVTLLKVAPGIQLTDNVALRHVALSDAKLPLQFVVADQDDDTSQPGRLLPGTSVGGRSRLKEQPGVRTTGLEERRLERSRSLRVDAHGEEGAHPPRTLVRSRPEPGPPRGL